MVQFPRKKKHKVIYVLMTYARAMRGANTNAILLHKGKLLHVNDENDPAYGMLYTRLRYNL